MKRRLMLLTACVMLLFMALCATANAADDPLRVAMQLSTATFTGPQTINVSIQVSNTSDAEMPGAVTLYDPAGNQIEAFGSPTLAVGASKTWEGTWDVTEEQLVAGKITFKLRYPVYNDEGTLVNKTRSFTKTITYEGAVTAVEINRTITPTVAGNGKEVQVTYDVINTGTVDVSDVVITEDKSISSTKGKIANVAAGEKQSYTFKVTMGKKDLKSQATITYRANGTTQTVTKDAATIRYGENNLSVTAASDKKGGVPGDTVTLTITLKNTGKVDYSGISITDPRLGEVASGLAVAAGKTETVKLEQIINDTVSYQFTVSGLDASGNPIETAAEALSIKAMSADDVVALAVQASADRDTVYELPGKVKFHVSVTNNSTVDVSSVAVKASGVTLYTFPTILAGETREFTRDVNVSMQGQYQFTATTKNALGESVTFSSNIVPIGFAAPTAVPTDAPIVTPPVPKLEEIPTEADLDAESLKTQQTLAIGAKVAAGIAAVGLLLVLVGVIGRISKKAHSARAVDHLERNDTPRDYERPHTGSYEYGPAHDMTPAEAPAESDTPDADKTAPDAADQQ